MQLALEVPQDTTLTEANVQHLADQLRYAQESGTAVIAPAGCRIRRIDETAMEAQMARLLWILQLTPEERAFVQEALVGGNGPDFWQVFADYLEEKGVAGSERIRRTAPALLLPSSPEPVIRQGEPLRRQEALLRISMGVIHDLLRLPGSTRILDVSGEVGFDRAQLVLRVEDPAFRMTEDGHILPDAHPVYTRNGETGRVTFSWGEGAAIRGDYEPG